MARIRTIKPEFWQDEKIALLPPYARLLYIGMWNMSDDYGTVRSTPAFLKSQIFPYDEQMRTKDLSTWIDSLTKAQMLEPFEYNGQGFFNIRTFNEHQKIDKPSKPIVPLNEKNKLLAEYSPNTPRVEGDPSGLEGKGKEQGKEEGKEEEWKGDIPALEDFIFYAKQKMSVDDFISIEKALILKYESWIENNWKTGKGDKIKNWKTTLLNTIPYLGKEKSSAKKEKGFQKSGQLERVVDSHNTTNEYLT